MPRTAPIARTDENDDIERIAAPNSRAGGYVRPDSKPKRELTAKQLETLARARAKAIESRKNMSGERLREKAAILEARAAAMESAPKRDEPVLFAESKPKAKQRVKQIIEEVEEDDDEPVIIRRIIKKRQPKQIIEEVHEDAPAPAPAPIPAAAATSPPGMQAAATSPPGMQAAATSPPGMQAAPAKNVRDEPRLTSAHYARYFM